MENKKQKVFDQKITPFERLVAVMAVLRSENGCAWDRKQTHQSLLPYLIEETYEVAESIEKADYKELKEELGDLLCQAVFHAQIASERDDFNIDDSILHIVDKLIRRHPHVFGEQKDLNPDEVRDQWEKIKIESGEKKSVLGGLPSTMPALLRAFRVGEKAGGVGFDWKDSSDVFDKIEEEIKELKEEIKDNKQANIENELGDLLFAISSLSRKLEINPELALKKALNKFTMRFEKLETEIRADNGKFDDYSLEQLEEIWQKVKKEENIS